MVISSQLHDAWILSNVYNGQSIETQKSLCNELSHISILSFPWVIIGDFNPICFCIERKGDNLLTTPGKLVFSMISLLKMIYLMSILSVLISLGIIIE